MDNEQLIDLLRDALDFANYPGKLGDGSRFALARRIGLTLDALAAAPSAALSQGNTGSNPHFPPESASQTPSAAPVDAQPLAWMIENSHGNGRWSEPQIVTEKPEGYFPAVTRVTALYATAPAAPQQSPDELEVTAADLEAIRRFKLEQEGEAPEAPQQEPGGTRVDAIGLAEATERFGYSVTGDSAIIKDVRLAPMESLRILRYDIDHGGYGDGACMYESAIGDYVRWEDVELLLGICRGDKGVWSFGTPAAPSVPNRAESARARIAALHALVAELEGALALATTAAPAASQHEDKDKRIAELEDTLRDIAKCMGDEDYALAGEIIYNRVRR